VRAPKKRVLGEVILLVIFQDNIAMIDEYGNKIIFYKNNKNFNLVSAKIILTKL
jgi:hypothetical protein